MYIPATAGAQRKILRAVFALPGSWWNSYPKFSQAILEYYMLGRYQPGAADNEVNTSRYYRQGIKHFFLFQKAVYKCTSLYEEKVTDVREGYNR